MEEKKNTIHDNTTTSEEEQSFNISISLSYCTFSGSLYSTVLLFFIIGMLTDLIIPS